MDKIQEIMGLVDLYAEACFDQALHNRIEDKAPEDAREVVESALRELVERKPLTYQKLQDIRLQRGVDIDAMLRDVERAHGIGA